MSLKKQFRINIRQRHLWKDVKQAGQNHQGGADGYCIHWQIDNREWGAWRECFTGMPFFALKYFNMRPRKLCYQVLGD